MHSEDHTTGHLDTGFLGFPTASKQILRWFPRFYAATTCFLFCPPGLNLPKLGESQPVVYRQLFMILVPSIHNIMQRPDVLVQLGYIWPNPVY